MRDEAWRRDRASYPWSLTLEVRFGDIDQNGHLNNVQFVRFFEEGRVRLHQQKGGKQVLGIRPVVGAITVNFLAEGFWPGTVEVASGISRFGNTSWTIAQALFQDGRCIGIADAVLVNRTADGKSAAPLPESFRQAVADLRTTG